MDITPGVLVNITIFIAATQVIHIIDCGFGLGIRGFVCSNRSTGLVFGSNVSSTTMKGIKFATIYNAM
jgi:hypothetical protein